MALNSVQLIGYVGQDPAVRYLSSGDPVAQFSLATTDYGTDEAGKRTESTEWHRLVCWNKKLVENVVAEHVKKGSQLYIEGKLRTRSYEGKDKIKRWVTEIRVNRIQLLDRKPKGETAPEAPASNDFLDDDIPF